MLLDLLSNHHRAIPRTQDWNAWGSSWGAAFGGVWGPVSKTTNFTDFPQPYGNAREASLPHKTSVSVHVTLAPSKVSVTVSDLTLHTGVTLALATTTVDVHGKDTVTSARASFKLAPASTTLKTSTIRATGRHDLSDEALITMFLELID